MGHGAWGMGHGAWGMGHGAWAFLVKRIYVVCMRRPDFEDLVVYQLAEKLANQIWQIVKEWDYFTKDTMGKQIV